MLLGSTLFPARVLRNAAGARMISPILNAQGLARLTVRRSLLSLVRRVLSWLFTDGLEHERGELTQILCNSSSQKRHHPRLIQSYVTGHKLPTPCGVVSGKRSTRSQQSSGQRHVLGRISLSRSQKILRIQGARLRYLGQERGTLRG